MIASVKWIDEQLKTTEKNETNSSFDSELSLVLWPDDDYALFEALTAELEQEYSEPDAVEKFVPTWEKLKSAARRATDS